MTNSPRFWCIIPAAGIGRRMGSDIPKQYLPLLGRTVIEHTLHRIGLVSGIEAIVLALADDDPHWDTLALDSPVELIRAEGGEERCHSVLNGLEKIADRAQENDWVLVHDAARPCVRPSDIEVMMNKLSAHPVGGVLGIPVHDTMKRTDTTGMIVDTVSREHLWHAMTPQMFSYHELKTALHSALEKKQLVTDEASALELYGKSPMMIEGHADNLKVTRPEDLAVAEFYIQHQNKYNLSPTLIDMDDGG